MSKITIEAVLKVLEYAALAIYGVVKVCKKETDIKTKFHCNARYTDAAGKVDHLVFGAELSPADGWKTLTFSFEIPADVKPLTTDEFTFYTNPANNEGVSYMFDNIKVVVE